MRIVTVDVMSANGKIIKGANDTHSWTSAADWKHFASLWAEHHVLIMDEETYEKVQPIPDPDHLRVVVTKHADRYAKNAVKDQLEFVDETPKEIVKRLKQAKHTLALLVGRSINAAFLKAGLVDEMHITVEPILFSDGPNLLDYKGVGAKLKLISTKKLNARGTLVLHYAVDR